MYLLRFAKVIFLRKFLRDMTSSSTKVYQAIFQRKKLAEDDIPEIIEINFDLASDIFAGCFGVPYTDVQLLTCTKVLHISDSHDPKFYKKFHRKFLLAQSFITRLEFTLTIVKIEEDSFKVMLSPSQQLSQYLSVKALNQNFSQVDTLYMRMR
jgi:hypothetical protein